MSAALDFSFEQREARAEKITCIVWLCVIITTYLFFVLGHDHTISPRLVQMIGILVAVMTPAFGLIIVMIERGLYSPSLKYVNTFLQVTLVSAAVLFDGLTQGPAYAFSSMPPMAYALVPMITAFRLQPMLGLFAGAVSSIEFLVIYLYLIPPDALLIREIPSLGFAVTMMKTCVLLALGVASAFSARSLQNYFIRHGKAQEVRIRLQRNFGRFVSPEIVNQIEKSEAGTIASSLQPAVIVFGDIRGFTAFSETVSPEAATRVLNEFFEIVCRIVEARGGMVNKFLGDGYLALFGVYSDDPRPCDSAAMAVLEIDRVATEMLAPLGLKPGAAANFGAVVAGEVGSKGRCEFTVIGQPVNLTARVEGLNGSLGTGFLATDSFVDHLDRGHYQIQSHGPHSFKGIAAPVEVFEVCRA